jgi:GT2 family glycosyltransferase
VSGLFSIIIPTFNGLDLLKRCVESIRLHTTGLSYELIVADNASQDGTAEWCLEQRIPIISLPRNEGFPGACNQGLRLAGGDTLVLLNNDTVVTPAWLNNMSMALYSAPDIAMAGPVTNYASGSQQVNVSFSNLEEFQFEAARNNISDPSRWKVTRRIVGICLVFRRSLMDCIGLLDERFAPGPYGDDDYCMRAGDAGFRLLVCHDSLIYHEGSATFRKQGAEEQQKLVERNYRLFLDKWKQHPRTMDDCSS